nr:hypothetical protein [Tanacetum cinerariifolium]
MCIRWVFFINPSEVKPQPKVKPSQPPPRNYTETMNNNSKVNVHPLGVSLVVSSFVSGVGGGFYDIPLVSLINAGGVGGGFYDITFVS